ncbi:hypothetical protein [Pseudoduganella aquatica]|uniref:hypothetical protein n=1 Tax=Pseudoduganella aquatica TaxID=2660641 RepID=UPI001E448FE8|nr:hypothetical protein [Pseudoduganella aquatica]
MKIIAFSMVFLFLLLVGYAILKKEPNSMAVSPSSEFNLTSKEIIDLEISARNGDCQAAYKLARYHGNFTLKSVDAIIWFREAVKCPGINPKLELIALLMGDENPMHKAEIAKLIHEIGKADPAAAKRAEEAVQASNSARRRGGKER